MIKPKVTADGDSMTVKDGDIILAKFAKPFVGDTTMHELWTGAGRYEMFTDGSTGTYYIYGYGTDTSKGKVVWDGTIPNWNKWKRTNLYEGDTYEPWERKQGEVIPSPTPIADEADKQIEKKKEQRAKKKKEKKEKSEPKPPQNVVVIGPGSARARALRKLLERKGIIPKNGEKNGN